ncbi:MAG: type VI secretion system tip protein VgrG [Niabella sp.]
MANERIIPSETAKSSCTYTIISEGNAVSKTYHLLGLTVQKEVNRITSATIVFADGSTAKESFGISNQEDFLPGQTIEIKLGYKAVEKTVFKGVVIKQSIKIREGGSSLVVECRHTAYQMTLTPKAKYFHDMKDSELMEELISLYGIENDIEATAFKNLQMVQYHATDWDFMLIRADINGYICVTNDEKIIIKKPDLSAAPALEIQYGATIYELDAEIDARLQMDKVIAKTWNPANQELDDQVEGDEPSLEEAGNVAASNLAERMGAISYNLVHGGFIQEEEAKEWVNAKLAKHRLAKIKGTVTTDGIADVNPGQFIKINGIGERFSGKLFVTGVTHLLEDGKWLTTFQFGLNTNWFTEQFTVSQPLAAAQLPAVQGLHVGKVTALEGDPDEEQRIQVVIPEIMKDDEGTWCRVCTLDAGEDRGTFFLPEINDEVIVGFVNNDPRFGIVLGMLHSSHNPAPFNASDDNHQKGYTSRSKMRLHFDDDKNSILIDTPEGNSILMAKDEGITISDQHGNKIVMNTDGILFESSKNITIKCDADFKSESGMNTEIKASAGATFKGQAQTELSASGTLTIKGAIVNIN